MARRPEHKYLALFSKHKKRLCQLNEFDNFVTQPLMFNKTHLNIPNFSGLLLSSIVLKLM